MKGRTRTATRTRSSLEADIPIFTVVNAKHYQAKSVGRIIFVFMFAVAHANLGDECTFPFNGFPHLCKRVLFSFRNYGNRNNAFILLSNRSKSVTYKIDRLIARPIPLPLWPRVRVNYSSEHRHKGP